MFFIALYLSFVCVLFSLVGLHKSTVFLNEIRYLDYNYSRHLNDTGDYNDALLADEYKHLIEEHFNETNVCSWSWVWYPFHFGFAQLTLICIILRNISIFNFIRCHFFRVSLLVCRPTIWVTFLGARGGVHARPSRARVRHAAVLRVRSRHLRHNCVPTHFATQESLQVFFVFRSGMWIFFLIFQLVVSLILFLFSFWYIFWNGTVAVILVFTFRFFPNVFSRTTTLIVLRLVITIILLFLGGFAKTILYNIGTTSLLIGTICHLIFVV
jgi:hypothetical protein